MAHTEDYQSLRQENYQPLCPHIAAQGRPECAHENTHSNSCTMMKLTIFAPTQVAAGAQAGWLASSFKKTAREFYDKTTEVSRKLALWGPLGSYLEGVAEVLKYLAGTRSQSELVWMEKIERHVLCG